MTNLALAKSEGTTRSHEMGQRSEGRRSHFELALAVAIALTLTIRTPFSSWLTVGATIALMILPVVLSRFVWRRTRWFLSLIVGAAVSGAILARVAIDQDRAREIVPDYFLFDLGSLIGLGLIVTASLWAVSRLGVRAFLLLWGVGYLPVAISSTPLWAVNPWKFALAFPVTVIILAIASHARNLSFFALVVLSVVSVIAGYRSWALGLLLAALVCTVLPRLSTIKRLGTLGKVFSFGLLSAISGWLVFELVLGGLFGESVRDRTILQLQWGDGNVILGGRSEWGAALAGIAYRPGGFGAGVAPSASDWGPLIEGQRVPEGLKDFTTVAQYMTAGRIEFHSTLWNFWSHYGLVGILLVAVVATVLIHAVIRAGSRHSSTAVLVCVVAIQVLWNLLFSPTVIVTLAAAVGVALWTTSEGGTKQIGVN